MRKSASLSILALCAGLACDDGGPDRALPEGTYNVRLTGCEECPPADTPDYLVALANGIEGTMRVSGATATGATLELVDMRRSTDATSDVLGWFPQTRVDLAWDEGLPDGPGFTGTMDFGGAAALLPTVRRDGDAISCSFTVFHLKHDVGDTTCVVAD